MSKEELGLYRNFAIEVGMWDFLSSAVAGLVFCSSGVLSLEFVLEEAPQTPVIVLSYVKHQLFSLG